MSNLTMITDLLGHAYQLEDDSPDEQHLKVRELIDMLVERDKALMDVVKSVANLDKHGMYKDIVQDAVWALEKIGEGK